MKYVVKLPESERYLVFNYNVQTIYTVADIADASRFSNRENIEKTMSYFNSNYEIIEVEDEVHS